MRVFIILFTLFVNYQAVANDLNCANTNLGVVVPLKHDSLDLIVDGLKSRLLKDCPNSKVIVKNAHGDMLVQSTLIKQLSNNKDLDYVVTVGTVATQMANSISKKPVLALAANEKTASSTNTYIVSEELPGKVVAEFIRSVAPKAKKVSVIHSMDDKIFAELSDIEKSLGYIKMQKLSVQNISDIYRVVNQISKDSDALLILKDHRVVSSVPLLKGVAQKNKIPLISLDEGSVKAGADFAIGVREYDIGSNGARLITLASKPKLFSMNNYVVFYRGDSQHKNEILLAKEYAIHNDLTATEVTVI